MTEEMKMNSLFEQSEGSYSVKGDYRLPNLSLTEHLEYHSGIWGKRRLDYLKKSQRILYVNLLTSGELAEHLHEIDTAAF